MKLWQGITLAFLAPTIFVACNMINKPAALVNKATNTDKMLANYEWFHEAANAYAARVSQIKAHKALHAELKDAPVTDQGELARVRIELGAMQHTCREIVSKYEAKTGQVHVGYLKGTSLPESLDPKACE